ncbi:E3 ubiquitin/ISG15 ligase TRIM25-like [Eleginops maclovinus]|uniref:E3 ubiquitin/ISG15 ligase TRIM25-like n=1 Tax=Eleginops maclovinus TaxID=56733 RepID=UPI0030805D82
MAECSTEPDPLSCLICFDRLKSPVTLHCGHSYCMDCVNGYWDQENNHGVYSCPQCRRTFSPRPELNKNTVLASLAGKVSGPEAPTPPVKDEVGPGDVECDFCTVRKLKAVKSCLVCLASYCATHLEPHYVSEAFKRHKLVETSSSIQEKICPKHDKLLEVYCRTDGQCICLLCVMDEHKGHDTVSAAAERKDKQKKFGKNKLRYLKGIQKKEKQLQQLKQKMNALQGSGDAAIDQNEKAFAEIVAMADERRCAIKELIRVQQKAAVSRAEAFVDRLEKDISKLREGEDQLKQLSLTEDHILFLQLLEDPVTTSCGHSYCMKCINNFWDGHNERGKSYSCPQCRQTFCPRPDLKRNTLLAALLEEHRKTNSEQADNSTHAATGDGQCDACTGRKRKACMFCLVCLASYCETHLKPHLQVPPLKKHNLIKASAWVKDRICGHHDKLREIYCRTDQQFICLLCAMDEHKGHDTVAVSAEKCQMQRQLEQTKQKIADRLLHSESKIMELRQAADSIRDAAWEASYDLERLCVERIRTLVRSVEKKRSEMRERIGEAEKSGVDWINICVGQVEREVSELRSREDRLNQLSLTEDPIQFVQGFKALRDPPVSTDSHESPDTLTEFISEQTKKLKNMCNKEKKELLHHPEENLLSKEPSFHEKTLSRMYLLTRYKNTTMEVDPNTVAACLYLSDRNREISWSDRDQAHPDHADRFTFYHQALCKNSLQYSHYWEVEWDGGVVDLAVSYRSIERKGSGKSCSFGHNELSWKLTCSLSGCTFWHNNLHKGQIPPVLSRRVGIHLDYEAGTLGFYSVSDSGSFTRLHHVKTIFSEPLYHGFSVDLGATLKICNI